MADLTRLQADLPVNLAGVNQATGNSTFFVGVDSAGGLTVAGEGVAGTPAGGVVSVQGVTGGTAVPVSQSTSPWIISDNSLGSVTGGTAGTQSALAGGIYDSTPPTLTNGQQSALQLTSAGALVVSATLPYNTNYGTVGASTLRTASQIGNATGGADFAAGNSSAQTLRVVIASNQVAIPVTGTFWQTTQPVSGTVAATQSGTWTTGRTWTLASSGDSVSAVTYGLANTTPPTFVNGTQYPLSLTINSDLRVADIVNTAGQYRAQSVTTSATEALGGATILANRKMLSITPTNGIVYWGFNNSVTTTTGSPIFKNQQMTFAVGANVHIYVVASGTTDCRMSEGS